MTLAPLSVVFLKLSSPAKKKDDKEIKESVEKKTALKENLDKLQVEKENYNLL